MSEEASWVDVLAEARAVNDDFDYVVEIEF
jgi:hypothetical protein